MNRSSPLLQNWASIFKFEGMYLQASNVNALYGIKSSSISVVYYKQGVILKFHLPRDDHWAPDDLKVELELVPNKFFICG